MTKKIRASVILIKNKKVLVAESKYSSGTIFFLLPGGNVEDYETLEEAAVREVKEETNYDINLGKIITYSQYLDKAKDKDVLEIIFLGKIISGKETHLNDPSKAGHIINLNWMTYKELCKKEFYPVKVLKILKKMIG